MGMFALPMIVGEVGRYASRRIRIAAHLGKRGTYLRIHGRERVSRQAAYASPTLSVRVSPWRKSGKVRGET